MCNGFLFHSISLFLFSSHKNNIYQSHTCHRYFMDRGRRLWTSLFGKVILQTHYICIYILVFLSLIKYPMLSIIKNTMLNMFGDKTSGKGFLVLFKCYFCLLKGICSHGSKQQQPLIARQPMATRFHLINIAYSSLMVNQKLYQPECFRLLQVFN